MTEPSNAEESIAVENAVFAGKPWHDATAYGAAGDGEADGAAAVQSAVEAAADGGGTVYLPPGRYRVGSAVTLRSGVRLRGEGTGATALVADGEGYAALEGFGSAADPLTDVTVADLAIDCSDLGGDGYSTGEKCVYFQHVRRCRIRGVHAIGAPATGIGTDFMVESLVHGCVAEGNGRFWEPGRIGANGIGIGTGRDAAETVVVSDCHARDNGNNGVMFEAQGPPDEAVHSGCMTATGCTARGNRIGFRDSADRRVKFVGCSAADNDEHGFVVSDKDDTPDSAAEHRVGDCHAVDNGGDGVRVMGAASDARLAVADCHVAGNAECGVRFAAPSGGGGVTVANCTVYDNAADGIRHENGGDHVAVRGCDVRDNDGDGVHLDAGEGRLRHATVSDCDCSGGGGFGVVLAGRHEGAKVLGNAFAGNGAGALRVAEGRPALVRDNVGYRTENGGRATVADGDEIRHGLAATPTTALLETQSTNRAYAERVDDETVTVALVDEAGARVEDDEPVFWEARVW